MNKENNLIQNSKVTSGKNYSLDDVIEELDELKNIALNSFDKNGNPNIQAALKAVECKAKIMNLSNKISTKSNATVQMGEVKIDGIQLKLNIGEDTQGETID